jgi:hypothetical protein
MRIAIILCLLVINSAFVFGQNAEFSFSDRIKKLDPINEGTPVQFTYEFTNSGSEPLIITEYDVECTCTKVVFPKNLFYRVQKGLSKSILIRPAKKVGNTERSTCLPIPKTK